MGGGGGQLKEHRQKRDWCHGPGSLSLSLSLSGRHGEKRVGVRKKKKSLLKGCGGNRLCGADRYG